MLLHVIVLKAYDGYLECNFIYMKEPTIQTQKIFSSNKYIACCFFPSSRLQYIYIYGYLKFIMSGK